MAHRCSKKMSENTKQLILFVLTLLAFLTTVQCHVWNSRFMNAQPREAIFQRYGDTLPDGWSAAVLKKGEYIRWWTEDQKPFASGACFILMVVSGITWLISVSALCIRIRRSSRPRWFDSINPDGPDDAKPAWKPYDNQGLF